MPKNNMPVYIARSKQGDNWMTIGAVWPMETKDKREGFSVKLNAIPTDWDGSFILIPSKEEE